MFHTSLSCWHNDIHFLLLFFSSLFPISLQNRAILSSTWFSQRTFYYYFFYSSSTSNVIYQFVLFQMLLLCSIKDHYSSAIEYCIEFLWNGKKKKCQWNQKSIVKRTKEKIRVSFDSQTYFWINDCSGNFNAENG